MAREIVFITEKRILERAHDFARLQLPTFSMKSLNLLVARRNTTCLANFPLFSKTPLPPCISLRAINASFLSITGQIIEFRYFLTFDAGSRRHSESHIYKCKFRNFEIREQVCREWRMFVLSYILLIFITLIQRGLTGGPCPHSPDR